jgi:UDP-galactopyranose mutase
MEELNAVVAGAGIWGCTVARRLAESGRKVLVLEKRDVTGGNVRCETDPETGIEIHTYGSHIFHTHDDEVWKFIRRFVDFNGYQHKVMASYRNKTYFLPLGLALINKFFNIELSPSQVADFMKDERNSKAVFDAFFRGYTSKQWGKPPESIDPGIIRRVPVRANYDINYFNDYNQGIPLSGYNSLFERLLDHPNITVECSRGYRLGDFPGTKVYYSGPVDQLFDYRFGALPWRSLRFETERLDIADFQGTSVVNYPDAEIPYTRIHEFKHYHPELKDAMSMSATVIMREYPSDWKIGDEPYYPMSDAAAVELAERYGEEARKIPDLVIGGRLGAYKYLDMDQAMGAALRLEL